jgi:hypothetical protein
LRDHAPEVPESFNRKYEYSICDMSVGEFPALAIIFTRRQKECESLQVKLLQLKNRIFYPLDWEKSHFLDLFTSDHTLKTAMI